MLLFHESSISGKQITRTPDLFHDRPPYKLNEKEEQHFKKMWDQASVAKAMREKYPKVQIRFGNGPCRQEESSATSSPPSCSIRPGNEAAGFGGLPETQPPDYLAVNASLWMDRQMLDAYGYKDKPMTMCHEVCYPSTAPGNLDPQTQADYFVRHSLHALAWGICSVAGTRRPCRRADLRLPILLWPARAKRLGRKTNARPPNMFRTGHSSAAIQLTGFPALSSVTTGSIWLKPLPHFVSRVPAVHFDVKRQFDRRLAGILRSRESSRSLPPVVRNDREGPLGQVVSGGNHIGSPRRAGERVVIVGRDDAEHAWARTAD